MRKLSKGFGWVVAMMIPAGMIATPAAAKAQGFRCGANNPLTQNTRPKVDEDRKTNSGSIDRDRIEKALAKASRDAKGGGLLRD